MSAQISTKIEVYVPLKRGAEICFIAQVEEKQISLTYLNPSKKKTETYLTIKYRITYMTLLVLNFWFSQL